MLFGGITQSSTYLADTWEYDGSTWKLMASTGPTARYDFAMAYDPVHAQTILFGGKASGTYGDTWAWNGTAWTALFPATSPPARYGHGITFDSDKQRLVMAAGYALSDTWEWTGSDWVKDTPAAVPTAAQIQSLAYDPIIHRSIFYGGWTGSYLSGAWHYSTTWTFVSASDPGTLWGGGLAFDGRSGSVMIAGGYTGSGATSKAWFYNGVSYTALPNLPSARYAPHLAYDPVRQKMVMFGGSDNTTTYADTWEY